MKKIALLGLSLLLLFLCGCGRGGSEVDFAQLPRHFVFASGAGGWSTQLDLNPDGTFSGQYRDSDAGDTGKGYSGGTVYLCEFSGAFTAPVPVNAYTYSMSLKELTPKGTLGEARVEDGVRTITSGPYGLEGEGNFLLYAPGAPLKELPEGFVSWLYAFLDVKTAQTLPFYGIYNVSGEMGFAAVTP